MLFNFDYTICVPVDTAQIKLTNYFSGGTVKLNGENICLNKVAKAISLNEDVNTITLSRAGVDGTIDSVYTFTIVKDNIYSNVSQSGDSLTIDVISSTGEELNVYLVGYDEADRMLACQVNEILTSVCSLEYKILRDSQSNVVKLQTQADGGDNIEATADDAFSYFKLFIWDKNQNPKSENQIIEFDKGGYLDVVLESDHQYSDNCDETKTYVYDGVCSSIDVTFSSDTETESGYDYIYIYDANNTQIGKYTGTALAGKTINVPGNTVKIRLTSDGSVTRYGYKTESVFVNISASTKPTTPSTVINYGTYTPIETGTYNGHHYAVYGKGISWTNAKSYCEGVDGHLATITSQNEQDYVYSLTNGRSCWLGGYCDSNYNYSWVTGEPWSYTNWGSGEPSRGKENRLAIWPRYWNDLIDASGEQSGFVCEWEY